MKRRAVTTSFVAYEVAALLSSPACRTELMFRSGDTDPCGVILRYRNDEGIFLLLVSQPQTQERAREIVPLVPLPFPED